jgi:hypothetical protein
VRTHGVWNEAGELDGAKMEKLRRNRRGVTARNGAMSGGVPAWYETQLAYRIAVDLHAQVHFFAALSRFITEIERATTLGFANGFPVSRI